MTYIFQISCVIHTRSSFETSTLPVCKDRSGRLTFCERSSEFTAIAVIGVHLSAMILSITS